MKPTGGKKVQKAQFQTGSAPVPNKSSPLFVTTRVSSTQPSGETFLAKPEIRRAGIVDVEFGKDVIVVQPVNLYGCTIGDGSFVGPFVEIQKGVNIGQAMQDSIALIHL